MLEFILILVSEAVRLGLIYIVENPNSWMWAQPAWSKISSEFLLKDFLTDYCVYETRWKKATRFRTNGQLGGKRLRCSRDHSHVILRGRDKTTGVNFTKLAEPYPKRLCELLAQALAQDARWIEGCRPLARCAKCTGARFGEARNPGPRPRRRRSAAALAEVPLVEPAAATLSLSIWSRFVAWLSTDSSEQLEETVLSFPELLVEMLVAFGQVLYNDGAPPQHYRLLLAHAQRLAPRSRALMRPAWDNLTRWERLEPTCFLAIVWNWRRWAMVSILAFFGCCRVGEVFQALRADLLTPSDLLRTDGRFFLRIRNPKSRGRGARIQHCTISLDL